jgi:hypothetical protein
MNGGVFSRVLWLTAAVAVAVGVAISAATLLGLADRRERREAKHGYLRELNAIAAELEPYRAAHDECRRTATGQPVSPQGLLREIGGPAADDVRRGTRDIGNGWQAARKTFVFNKTAIAPIMTFIDRAEAAQPPWNLVRCDVRALSRERGMAAVTVELETLQGPSN